MPNAPLDTAARTYVAGHRGLVGGAIVRHLQGSGCTDIVTATSAEVDLRERGAVDAFFAERRPAAVVLAAPKVGGILANATYPADLLSDNICIQVNVLDAAAKYGTTKLLFLGSSCIYPKFAEQPILEDSLLMGLLEPTNDAYAIAKIVGVLPVQAQHRQHGLHNNSAMPTSPVDFSAEGSHVVLGLIRRFKNARVAGDPAVTVWGTGTPRREFLQVDDLAICELAELVARTVGYAGELMFDTTKPDGTPRKLLDVSTIHDLGWRAQIELEQGLADTVDWYRGQLAAGTVRAA